MKSLILISLGAILFAVALSSCTAGEYEGISWPETESGVIANVTSTCTSGQPGLFSRYCTESDTWDNIVTSNCTVQCPVDEVSGVTFPLTDANTTVTEACPSGYTGNLTRLCNTSGSWETPTGECVPVVTGGCSAETAGGYSWDNTPSGETASVACHEGYSGSATRTCTDDVWGSVDETGCTRNMCRGEEYQGYVWEDTLSMTNAAQSCPEGQAGQIFRECTASGAWASDLVSTCSSVMCPAGEAQGVMWETTAGGQTAQAECPAGFTGEMTRVCSAEGVWAEPVSNCQAIQCAAEMFDGISYPATNANSTVTAPCPPGQSGSKTRFCKIDGLWDAPQGECTVLSCAAELNIVEWPLTQAGQSSTVKCPTGMKGTTTRACQLDGTWAPAADPECQGTYCEADLENPKTPAGRLIEKPCGAGVEGSRYYYCRTNGEWASPVSHCDTLRCIANTVDGVSYPQTEAGQTATVPCEAGFTGSYTRMCSATGQWQQPVNTCTPIMCPAQTFELSSGSYTLEMSEPGEQSLPCGSGFEGTVSVECLSSFTWSTPAERCTRVKCSETVLTGVLVPETVLGSEYSAECSLGWVGSFNATCLSTGEWEVNHPCEQITCDAETSGSMNWKTTPAGESDTIQCSSIYPTKVGEITRACLAEGVWADPVDGCTEGTPNTFTYERPEILAVVEQPIIEVKPVLNGVVFTSFTIQNYANLPVVGFSIDSDGTIRGEAFKARPREVFTIVASNANGQAEATIAITVNDHICEEDGDWYATYINMAVENKCSIPFAKEVRQCKLNESTMMAEWGKVDGQCTMIMIITIAIVAVVVLAIIIVLIFVIRNSSGRVRYSPKRAQVKMIELAGV